MAKIEVVTCDRCNNFHLRMNGTDVMLTNSRGVCVRLARVFTEASNMTRREALGYIAEHVGYELDKALEILELLAGERATLRMSSVNHTRH